uniref:Uncharacterized protein n=1 Tax=Clastoptera arizonana TaxID=38151 RepID=A0A1B6C8W9_9HEMI
MLGGNPPRPPARPPWPTIHQAEISPLPPPAHQATDGFRHGVYSLFPGGTDIYATPRFAHSQPSTSVQLPPGGPYHGLLTTHKDSLFYPPTSPYHGGISPVMPPW